MSRIMDRMSSNTLSGPHIDIKGLKSALISIPQEIRDMIDSCLLVNPVLGQATSVSSETTYGSTQKYDLDIAILYVYCSNSPGDWSFTDGVFDDGCLEDEEDQVNGILEPYIINLCPLTRYTNCERKKHQDKPLFRNTPEIERVKTWNILLNYFNKNICWNTQLSSNAFAELCVTVYACPGICLNISILPINFQNLQTRTEYGPFELEGGLNNNLLPLKMMRNIKKLVIKGAELPVIPDYCYRRDIGRRLPPVDLSAPDLPSPELISEYVKLTSGVTPIIECVGLVGERLKEYFWIFHRAEFVVIERAFPGLRRSIRVHDLLICPPKVVNSGLVIQEGEQSFLDCGELVEIIGAVKDSSLEHTETAEDVLLLKQY
ncbi:hypothetical protein BHYA_0382g00040 [Botrytis hyacinthi]|uniref:Uncharacterized protein n=1 Tax=Botrytis hyacinthi TaxID=278943 RepID=A0A4Z1GCF6_9HELO|nr:hypothetical protein BHYA_0382g00040 [Botrytis hyacinthi]